LAPRRRRERRRKKKREKEERVKRRDMLSGRIYIFQFCVAAEEYIFQLFPRLCLTD